MPTDQELLEGAAKAAGLKIVDKSPPISLYVHSDGCCGGAHWNPLADDGDALRLAVKLNLLQEPRFIHERDVLMFTKNTPKLEATRRAIVRAAYEIGKAT